MKHMTQKILLALCFVGAASGTSFAMDMNDEIELIRTNIQADRKAIVATNMNLTGTESAAFWPVYNNYQVARNKVNDRKVKLITDYAKSYNNMTDAQAKAMLAELLDIEKAKIKIQQSYVKKFENVLPSKKVARYYQIENKLDAIINIQLADGVPLVQ